MSLEVIFNEKKKKTVTYFAPFSFLSTYYLVSLMTNHILHYLCLQLNVRILRDKIWLYDSVFCQVSIEFFFVVYMLFFL